MGRCGHFHVRALAVQCVDDGDVRVDFDGLAIEDRWAIAPLADGAECGLDEERIAGDHFQGLNRAVGGYDGMKFDAPFSAKLHSQWRIDWFYAANEHSLLHGCADFEPFFRARRCDGRRGLAARAWRS